MNATAYAGSLTSHPSSHAATKQHCFIETSGEINEFMKMHVINLAERGLRQVGKRLYRANIAVMGLAGGRGREEPVCGRRGNCVPGDWKRGLLRSFTTPCP